MELPIKPRPIIVTILILFNIYLDINFFNTSIKYLFSFFVPKDTLIYSGKLYTFMFLTKIPLELKKLL